MDTPGIESSVCAPDVIVTVLVPCGNNPLNAPFVIVAHVPAKQNCPVLSLNPTGYCVLVPVIVTFCAEIKPGKTRAVIAANSIRIFIGTRPPRRSSIQGLEFDRTVPLQVPTR